jgi:hypothetical protein
MKMIATIVFGENPGWMVGISNRKIEINDAIDFFRIAYPIIKL